MQVEELYDVTSWVKAEIEKKQVINYYQAVSNILQQNIHSSPKQPFEQQRDALFEVLRNIDLGRLNNVQAEFLRRIGIAGAVGEEAIARLEDILFRNSLDPATAAQKFQEILSTLANAVQWSNDMRERLNQYFDFSPPSIGNDDYLLRVTFTRDAHLENVEDFKKWGEIWFDIGRGIAMAHNLTPQDVRIVGASRGSIVVVMATVYVLAKTVAKILEAALQVADKCYEIRRKAEEIRGLKLKNDAVAAQLEEEARTEKSSMVEAITADIRVTLNLGNADGDKANAIAKSVRNLVEFIDRGGELDCIAPDSAESEPPEEAEQLVKDRYAQSKQLRDAFNEIRRLEHKVRRIEDRSGDGARPPEAAP